MRPTGTTNFLLVGSLNAITGNRFYSSFEGSQKIWRKS